MNNVTPLYAITGLILWFIISCLTTINSIQKLEIIKVWWVDNYKQLQVLYKSDAYKKMQTDAILTLEAQLMQLSNPISSTGDKDETFADRK